MKKSFAIALCITLVFSSLMVTVGTVSAAAPGYEVVEQFGIQPVTIDGKWTTTDEWHDTYVQYMGTPQKALFEYKVNTPDGYVTINIQLLLEFADHTNDPGDRWQICFGTGGSTATAPTSGDNRFEIEGHTTFKTYVGTGTGWSLTSTPADMSWKDSLTSSPHDPATHYVLEVQFNKMTTSWGGGYPPYGIRIAMYDASNPSQGWVSWPPTSTDTNPSGWGQIGAEPGMGEYPEGLTVGLMLSLSAVAAAVSIRYFRKPPKL
jgi:hypothetical protein